MRDAAIELLAKNIKNENPDGDSVRSKYGINTLATGFLGTNVLTPVLSEMGRSDISYDLLLQDEQPSWLYEVKAGATTIWERWNTYTMGKGFGTADMNSYNHYSYGAVAEWMYRYMAGIAVDVDNPGFKNIVFQPVLDIGETYNSQTRIHSVDGTYESYYGEIRSAWTSSGEGGDTKLETYHVKVPANTTATVYLPANETLIKSVKGSGSFWSVIGVSDAESTKHNGQKVIKVQLESGGYDFHMKNGGIQVTHAEGYVVEGIDKNS